MTRRRHSRSIFRLTTVALASFAMACGDATPSTTDSTHGAKTQTSDGSVDIARTSYRAVALSSVGSVTGHVLADGAIPTGGASESDSALAAASEDSTNDCRRAPAAAIVHQGNGIGNAVVWIDSVSSGKPLPSVRRLEVTQVGCEFGPRVQVAVTGSTIDVGNADQGVHFIDTRDVGGTAKRSLDRFNDDGQVVPDDKLARTPGMVELQCRQHPQTKAFVAVFDHPYATVTNADGSFRIDSLPPGRYRLMVWHERASRLSSVPIVVAAGGSANTDVRIALR